MCQSYYPIYHGPLTAAQAAASNPSNKPIEQSVLTAAATAIGKPIFLIEVGEHYENGFDSNDVWYGATINNQRQFLIDVNGVLKGLPNNLGMGMEYWDATGVNVFVSGGGYSNADGKIDSLYQWNGLTLFDNADTQGYSNANLSNYSSTLPGLDALGGKLDAALSYKFVNKSTGQILETSLAATAQGRHSTRPRTPAASVSISSGPSRATATDTSPLRTAIRLPAPTFSTPALAPRPAPRSSRTQQLARSPPRRSGMWSQRAAATLH